VFTLIINLLESGDDCNNYEFCTELWTFIDTARLQEIGERRKEICSEVLCIEVKIQEKTIIGKLQPFHCAGPYEFIIVHLSKKI